MANASNSREKSPPRSLSIRAVASRARVSPAVVSRLLRFESTGLQVSDKVRDRVLEAVRVSNYRPNNLVGIAMGTDNYMELRIMAGVLEEATRRRMTIVKMPREQLASKDGVVCALSGERPSGIISSWVLPPDRFAAFEEVNIPCVVVNATEDRPYGAIICEDGLAMRDLLTAMADHGIRDFAFVTRALGEMAAHRKRRSGYMDFCRRRRIEPCLADLLEWCKALESSPAAELPEGIRNWIASRPGPFAIVSDSRKALIALNGHLLRRSLQYARDYHLAEIGGDLLSCWAPPMWGIKLPFHEMGMAAVQMIARRWAVQEPQRSIRIRPTVVSPGGRE